ncbi:hypothetical protein F5I97DRAFT_1827810 [Phlebopus sp. FC_14]|nr:hypothetical protein F5I97DRAFT_1827810 [Phlebopus sp. FC_14]
MVLLDGHFGESAGQHLTASTVCGNLLMALPGLLQGLFWRVRLGYRLIGSIEAYVARASAVPSTTKLTNFTVVLLSDVFGLPFVDLTILADKRASDLGCDVWIPGLFDGSVVTPSSRSKGWNLEYHRASVVDPRTMSCIKGIREEKKYDKVGGVGIVIWHPGPLAEAEISVVNPRGFVLKVLSDCVGQHASYHRADDSIFPTKLQMKAEARFAAHKDKEGFVPYEFGRQAKPLLPFQGVKEFEKSMEQTTAWMQKVLAE